MNSPTEPDSPEPKAIREQPLAPAEEIGLLRGVDASCNRANEGLRVVEDYVRFVLDDRHLTELCKQLRHALVAALAEISTEDRHAARDTLADVGTTVKMASELSRESLADVLEANMQRVQQSLRSLEEFTKVAWPSAAGKLESLRYQSYTLQQAITATRLGCDRLADARLYVLLDGQADEAQFDRLVSELVAAEVDLLQLRDKQLADRDLLCRARQLRRLTAGTRTLAIINDRPDIALLSNADGVHVGQEELTVKDARTIVGPQRLVGVSTHSIEQAREAVLAGANYLGVGPTFPSGTKSFEHFPGLALVQQVSAEICLPAFAIGGIDLPQLPAVQAAGLSRVAVSGAVTQSPHPAASAGALRTALHSRSSHTT